MFCCSFIKLNIGHCRSAGAVGIAKIAVTAELPFTIRHPKQFCVHHIRPRKKVSKSLTASIDSREIRLHQIGRSSPLRNDSWETLRSELSAETNSGPVKSIWTMDIDISWSRNFPLILSRSVVLTGKFSQFLIIRKFYIFIVIVANLECLIDLLILFLRILVLDTPRSRGKNLSR